MSLPVRLAEFFVFAALMMPIFFSVVGAALRLLACADVESGFFCRWVTASGLGTSLEGGGVTGLLEGASYVRVYVPVH